MFPQLRRRLLSRQAIGGGISVDSDIGPFDRTASEKLQQGVERIREGAGSDARRFEMQHFRQRIRSLPIIQRLRMMTYPEGTSVTAPQRVADISPARW